MLPAAALPARRLQRADWSLDESLSQEAPGFTPRGFSFGAVDARARPLAAALLALALLATLAAYWPGLHGGFVFDDGPNLIDNRDLVLHEFSVAELLRVAGSDVGSGGARPLSMLMFAIERSLHGLDPFAMKAVNLGLHLVNGLLLWAVLLRCLRAPALRAPWPSETVPLVAGAVVGLWLLHPLNLTVVLYVVQRMTGLAAGATLLGVLAYLLLREQGAARPERAWWLIPSTAVCTLLGMLAKESGALLPLYLLVVEATLFGFRASSPTLRRVLGLHFIAFVALPGVFVLAFLCARPDWLEVRYAFRPFTLAERLLSEARVLLEYLGLIFWPNPARMGLYHDDFIISRGWLEPWTTLPACLLLGALALAVPLSARRRPLIAFGIAWYLAGHAMESTVIPLELMFEHRNYLPMVGPLLAVFALAAEALRGRLPRLPRIAVVVPLILALAGATAVRAGQWSHPLALAALEAEHRPASARAQYDLGRELMRRWLETGDTALAAPMRAAFERAAAADPDRPGPLFALLHLAWHAGREPEPELIDRLAARLGSARPQPSQPAEFAALVACAERGICRLQPALAQRLFDAALANPRLDEVWGADLLTQYARYWANVGGAPSAARALFRRVVELRPDVARYRLNLAGFHVAMGEVAAAREAIAGARTRDPLGREARRVAELERGLAALAEASGPEGIPGD